MAKLSKVRRIVSEVSRNFDEHHLCVLKHGRLTAMPFDVIAIDK